MAVSPIFFFSAPSQPTLYISQTILLYLPAKMETTQRHTTTKNADPTAKNDLLHSDPETADAGSLNSDEQYLVRPTAASQQQRVT